MRFFYTITYRQHIDQPIEKNMYNLYIIYHIIYYHIRIYIRANK